MKKKENVEMLSSEIDKIMRDIRIIEEQIKSYEEVKSFFIKKKNNDRIQKLESIKKYLLEKLEYKIDRG